MYISYMYYILIVIQGICILVSDIGVYDIGRFIVYLVICIFLCWEWGRFISCVPCYLYTWFYFIWEVIGLYTWFVYTEIPRVFQALGILFIYLLWWILDLLGSEVYPVGMGLSLGCYTGLGTQMVFFSSSTRVSQRLLYIISLILVWTSLFCSKDICGIS